MPFLIWAGFIALVVALIALDLGVLHRRSQVIGARQALRFTGLWVALALTFNVYIYFLYDNTAVPQFHANPSRACIGWSGGSGGSPFNS